MGIIKTRSVEIMPIDPLGADFAGAKGQADRKLQYWREAHQRFFARSLSNIDRQRSQGMPLVCERFCLIYNSPNVSQNTLE